MQEEIIVELTEEQIDSWKSKIQKFRGKIIKAPRVYVEAVFSELKIEKAELEKDISGSIYKIRTAAWEKYIVDETAFYKAILIELIKNEKDANEILNFCLKQYRDNNSNLNDEKNIVEFIGEFNGRIMPYIYDLSLSVTNSRRSRAGQTFEQIIYRVMDILELPYANQSTLGKKGFESINLTKKVDMLIPDKNTYLAKRTKCHIVTMKTTLRERWQEVVEEMSRTNILHMFLFTLDEGINNSFLEILKQHNITIVTYQHIKERFVNSSNVLSFEEYFKKELPDLLKSLN